MDSQIKNMVKDTNQLIEVLWTGGFDSTYRMIQLSKLNVTVQPYYLIDKRPSVKFELNAMNTIISEIRNHPETKCTILPLLQFNVSEIHPDNEITEAFKRLQKMTHLGSQYDWLSRFVKTHPGLEICIEKSEVGRLYCSILKNASVKKVTEGDISYIIIDDKESDFDMIKVFGNFHFPLPLFEKTKLEVLNEYKKLGFEDIVFKTWFCHTPVNNEPCGICNPCKTTVQEGFSFRLSPAGLKRNHYEIKYNKYLWFKIYKRFRYRLVGY